MTITKQAFAPIAKKLKNIAKAAKTKGKGKKGEEREFWKELTEGIDDMLEAHEDWIEEMNDEGDEDDVTDEGDEDAEEEEEEEEEDEEDAA